MRGMTAFDISVASRADFSFGIISKTEKVNVMQTILLKAEINLVY